MHTLHVVLVPARQEDILSDPAILDNLLFNFPGQTWFDWHEVGGRWDGYFGEQFPELSLNNPNVLPLEGNLTYVEQVLRSIELQQDSEFIRITSALKGSAVTVVEDTDGHILGFPVARDAIAAERMTKINSEISLEWHGILQATSLYDINSYANMSLYYITRLNDLVCGNWCPDSGFYDFASGSSHVRLTREFLNTGNAADSSLVAVDFHF